MMLDYHHPSNLKFWWLLLYVIFVARGEQDAIRDNNVAPETAASVDDDDDDVTKPHSLDCNQSYSVFQQQSPINDDSLHGDEGEAPPSAPEISKINVQIPRCSTNLGR